jgi:hypothetical protein
VTDRRVRLATVGAAGLAVVVAAAADPHGRIPGLAALGLIILLAELVGFRLGDGSFVPLAPAAVLVLIRTTALRGAPHNDDLRFLVVIVLAELLAVAARPPAACARGRWQPSFVRLAGGFAGFAAYALVVRYFDGGADRDVTLLALSAATIAVIGIDLLGRPHRWADLVHSGGVRAYAALAASGMLMALAAHGVGNSPAMGLLGVALFAVPLLAASYSFAQVDAVRRTTAQTIRALSVVPELANLATTGHADRVARLAGAIADHLALSPSERINLEHAARLHHLGHVCIDDTDVRGGLADPADVTETTARMLRETGHLAEAARVLDAAALHHRGKDASLPPETRLAAQVLKVASDYDDLTDGDAARQTAAIESLYAAPGYVYDPRVLAALELVTA